MVKLDFRFDSQTAQIGPQFAVAIAFCDAHRLKYLDVAARRRKRDNPSLIDCRYEWRGAAIHDRNFRAVDLDHCIVDAESVQSHQNVLGGRYGGAGFVCPAGWKLSRRGGGETNPQC